MIWTALAVAIILGIALLYIHDKRQTSDPCCAAFRFRAGGARYSPRSDHSSVSTASPTIARRPPATALPATGSTRRRAASVIISASAPSPTWTASAPSSLFRPHSPAKRLNLEEVGHALRRPVPARYLRPQPGRSQVGHLPPQLYDVLGIEIQANIGCILSRENSLF